MPTHLLEDILRASSEAATLAGDRMDRLLRTLHPFEALADWLDLRIGDPLPSREQVIAHLTLEVAGIDELLSRQVDAVLHDPDFQTLEATWRGLRGLVQLRMPEDNVKIRILDLDWSELTRDLTRAKDSDQSLLFKKVYSQEFGMPGGEPFGVLLGDYYVTHLRGVEHRDDASTLRSLSNVAAAAFSPFVAGAHHSLLGLDDFSDLERPIDFERSFKTKEYIAWNAARREDDMRFIGLTLPRVLMRLPYGDDPARADGFRYVEDVSGRGSRRYLWGNAVYAFGEVLIRAFQTSGWLAAIRGVQQDQESGGLVTSLVQDWHRTDRRGVASKGSLEVQLTDTQEKELNDLGFIPLLQCHNTGHAAFYGNQSLQDWRSVFQRQGLGDDLPEVNAKLSSMLQYMFCVSRFAHYVKVLAREKVGSYANADELQRLLSTWLIKYATAAHGATSAAQAKFPLREARVQVRETPGQPGTYSCVVHLRPHYQLDELATSIRIMTEVYAGQVK